MISHLSPEVEGNGLMSSLNNLKPKFNPMKSSEILSKATIMSGLNALKQQRASINRFDPTVQKLQKIGSPNRSVFKTSKENQPFAMNYQPLQPTVLFGGLNKFKSQNTTLSACIPEQSLVLSKESLTIKAEIKNKLKELELKLKNI